ncbi:MAG: family 43 glycosylhydrolase, partial [Bacteroidales bacterium]|nr:family 43 glycosylhydrolase [Bacteroidales bacterium]
MKKIAVILLAACISLAAGAQVYYSNPVIHADYSDPDVCRVGDDYYMTASSFNQFPGLPILHSKDLVNWQLVGAALDDYEYVFKPLAPIRVQHGNGVWAPTIRYHDGWFYIYCGDPDRGIFMVRTQNPRGEWE